MPFVDSGVLYHEFTVKQRLADGTSERVFLYVFDSNLQKNINVALNSFSFGIWTSQSVFNYLAIIFCAKSTIS